MIYAEMLLETLSLVAMSAKNCCCEAGVDCGQKHVRVEQPDSFLLL